MRGQSIPIGGEFAEGQGNKYKGLKQWRKGISGGLFDGF